MIQPNSPTPVKSETTEVLRRILLRRLRLLSPVDRDSQRVVTPEKRATFFAELAKLGYRVTNPDRYHDGLLSDYKTTIATLVSMRGGDVAYVPLFQGFPESVPEQGRYLLRRISGYLGNVVGSFESGTTLRNGVVIPDWLFDLGEFGADPITQMQDLGLFEQGVERQASRATDVVAQWINLTIVDASDADAKLHEYLLQNLYSASSIKDGVKADLQVLLEHFGGDSIEEDRVVFKETRTLLAKYYWDRDRLDQAAGWLDSPTDLLRLFAASTGSDMSLAEPIRYPRFTRRQRRFILELLQRSSSLGEDLNRYRGLWIAIAKSLHSHEFAARFPKACKAIATLRQGRIQTFGSDVEKAIRTDDISGAIELLKTRPGIMARRLQELVSRAGTRVDDVVDAFAVVADQVPLRNLLVLETHFMTAAESAYRTVINKRGRIRVIERRDPPLAPDVTRRLVETIRKAIASKIRNDKSAWNGKRVFVDKRLRNYTVPLSQRAASDGAMTLGRGSCIPLEPGNVVRLFVYWKETGIRTDLDLSLIQYDDRMQYTGHVSYTNLKGQGIVHSGDIQSAPHGAAEFIDIDLKEVRTLANCRYIAPLVYRYAGDAFANLVCHSGWMIRSEVNSSYQSFDIKTVQNKFDLTGSTSYCLPIVVDLKEMKVIFVDLYVGKVEQGNRVEESTKDISLITQQMVQMIDTRPNLFDLAMHHAAARGASVCEVASDADICFGVETGDFKATDVAKWLSEML